MNGNAHIKTCTLCGTITIVLANILSSDILKTAVLAAIGATVSFVMSQLLKWLINWWKRPHT